MTEEMLQQLIARGETGTVELKVNAPRPSELAERMCGMAHTRTGGAIIFGVEDSTLAPVGVAQPSETIDVIMRAARMPSRLSSCQTIASMCGRSISDPL